MIKKGGVMKSRFKTWAYPILIFCIAGCGPTAHVEKDKTADFNSYKTFAWATQKKKAIDLTEQKIRAAVNTELEKQTGWKQVTHNPDILLSYDVLVEKSVQQNTNPVYSRPYTRLVYNPYRKHYTTIYFPAQFIGYEKDSYPIKEGTLTISMLDTRTDNMIWQGWATDEVNNRNLTTNEIENSVRSIFRKFDVAKK